MRYLLLQTINKLTGRFGYKDFAKQMRIRESGDRYNIKNSLGYLGAYQFGMTRLCDLGLTQKSGSGYKWKSGYSEKKFLNSPEIQDDCFKRHICDLIVKVEIWFGEYLNKEVNGVYITKAGLVAGAHIGGIGGVEKFLIYGENKKDVYNTSVRDYIISFRDFVL